MSDMGHSADFDVPAANVCEHHYMWSSPAGSRYSARLCMGCYAPDPEWLNRLYAGENARQTLRERLYVALVEQRAIDSQHFGEAPYEPVTWEYIDSVLPPAEGDA